MNGNILQGGEFSLHEVLLDFNGCHDVLHTETAQTLAPAASATAA
jgi:hypothetical protein